MTKVKPIVVSSDSDDHKTKNGVSKNSLNGKGSETNVKILDFSDLDDDDKDLCLIQLPKELRKHQQQLLELNLNLNKLKNGERFNFLGNDYEANLTKAKVDLNCLCKNGDSFTTVNNFKYVIQIKKCIDLPPIEPPQIEIKKVEVPNSIDNYLAKKNKSFKKAIKEQLKNLDSSSAKRKIKSEPIEENHIKNKKRKTS